MTLLILGLILWYVTHLFPMMAANRRAALVARLGPGPYRGAFSLVTLLAVVLMVLGYQGAEPVSLWYPPEWTRHLNNLLMVFAVLLVTARGTGSVVASTIRHPMLTGVKVWALAHLIVRGDLPAVILFGGLLIWAVVALIATNRRDGKGPKPEHGGMAATAKHLIITLVVLVVIIAIHGYVGPSPLPHSG